MVLIRKIDKILIDAVQEIRRITFTGRGFHVHGTTRTDREYSYRARFWLRLMILDKAAGEYLPGKYREYSFRARFWLRLMILDKAAGEYLPGKYRKNPFGGMRHGKNK